MQKVINHWKKKVAWIKRKYLIKPNTATKRHVPPFFENQQVAV